MVFIAAFVIAFTAIAVTYWGRRRHTLHYTQRAFMTRGAHDLSSLPPPSYFSTATSVQTIASVPRASPIDKYIRHVEARGGVARDKFNQGAHTTTSSVGTTTWGTSSLPRT